jgi:phosphoglycolate phosphatase
MPKLVLFDIDGTLVLTGGAGVRAMMRAFEAVMGVPSGADALNGIPVAGRTDWIILHEALSRMGHQLDEPLFQRLRESYIAFLRQEILQRGTGVNGTLPGVVPLLDQLQARDDVFLGLLTGNFKEGAQIKLERFDLWRYFACGAYGDDAADRNALVPVALDRASACGLPALSPSDVIVVGDTPHDVACAHAVGAVAVGVATGSFSVDQLRDCGAAAVFKTLEDADSFGRLLR